MSNSTSYLITPNRAISTVDMNVGKMGQQNGVVHILILHIKVYKINRLVWQRPNNIKRPAEVPNSTSGMEHVCHPSST